jgi:hypothetical protein
MDVAATQAVPFLIPQLGGLVKISVDATLTKNTWGGTVVAVARNFSGEYLSASAGVFTGKTGADMLEAWAYCEAIDLARNINSRRVMVASDYTNEIPSLEQGNCGVLCSCGPRHFGLDIDRLAMRVGAHILLLLK